MSAEREHYPIVCRLDQRDLVLLWYSDDADGFVVDSRGSLLQFADPGAAIAYARENALAVVAGELVAYDLDALQSWIVDAHEVVDCKLLLDCWNLFADVASSTEHGAEFSRRDRAIPTIYDKLFWGNNLPAVTPPGCAYGPVWSYAELDEIGAVMGAGIQLIRAAAQGTV